MVSRDIHTSVSAQSSGNLRRSPLRIDFALITLTGNKTVFSTLRAGVDTDPRVRARWFPIRSWVMGDWMHRLPLSLLPAAVRVRLRHFLDSWRFLLAVPAADVVVIHAFETYPLYALLHRILPWRRRRTHIIYHGDDGIFMPRAGLHGWIYRLTTRETALIAPFSQWAVERTRSRYPDIPSDHYVVLHPGLDLTRWPLRTPAAWREDESFRLLFVGSDASRKGLDTLLDALTLLPSTANYTADIVTEAVNLPDAWRERIARMPQVRLHLGLTPNSPALQALYSEASAFVLPTTFDCSSYASLEAMATGIPVIASAVGGIPEIVVDGETGLLVAPRDAHAVAAALERLRTDSALRERLITQGRRHVETHFDAAINTRKLVDLALALATREQRGLRSPGSMPR